MLTVPHSHYRYVKTCLHSLARSNVSKDITIATFVLQSSESSLLRSRDTTFREWIFRRICRPLRWWIGRGLRNDGEGIEPLRVTNGSDKSFLIHQKRTETYSFFFCWWSWCGSTKRSQAQKTRNPPCFIIPYEWLPLPKNRRLVRTHKMISWFESLDEVVQWRCEGFRFCEAGRRSR